MVVVYIVKELNDYFKAKMPVPIPIEIILVSIDFPSAPYDHKHVSHILQ